MNIRPVNSEQAYDEAIERIETLWGAESGTPEGDELDVLLTLVRVYEKEISFRLMSEAKAESSKFKELEAFYVKEDRRGRS